MMKNLIYAIILCGFIIASCCSAAPDKPELNVLDSFFLENPELLPEPFTLCETWPKVEMNNRAISVVIESSIKPILERYRPDSKKLIYASQYNCSTYYFRLVSSIEHVPFKLERDSDGAVINTSIAGYGFIDSLYILYDRDIKGLKIDSIGKRHEFELKLLSDISQDETFEWWATDMDSAVSVFSVLNIQPISKLSQERLIESLNALDEHEF